MKRLIAMALALFFICGLTPTTLAADPTVEAATLEELQNAITQAADGDIIRITQTIAVNGTTQLGDSSKQVTLKGSEDISTLLLFNGPYGNPHDILVTNLSFDGQGMLPGSKVMIGSGDDVINFHQVSWINCAATETGTVANGGGVYNSNDRTITLKDCSFENCSASSGSAIYNRWGATCYIEDCTFSNNSATSNGTVFTLGTCTMTQCAFTQNQAGVQGGAVFGARFTIKDSTFTENSAQMGGAIFCSADSMEAENSTFTGNTATSGGAIMSDAATTIKDCTLTGNQAEVGGGLFLQSAGSITDSKIYGNAATEYAADLISSSTVSIIAEDYAALYADELAANNFDSFAWCVDGQESRYSYDNRVAAIFDEYGNINAPALVFAMWDSMPMTDPDPEPDPTPMPDPEPGSDDDYWPIYRPRPQPKPQPDYSEPAEEPTLIVCGSCALDRGMIEEYINFSERFIAGGEYIYRGQLAYILYSLADMSQPESTSVDAFSDIVGSPYRIAINALTRAGVFAGHSDGTFHPIEKLSNGQLLTVLTRFVAPIDDLPATGEESSHWAFSAAQIALAYGWIDSTNIDLDAPATYSQLISVLSEMLSQ